jgi:hypothetical protein
LTSNGVLYGQGASALAVTAAGTSGQLLVANASAVPTFVSMGTDATLSAAGALTISADAVALGTDTTGNYVATVSGSTDLTVTGSGVETAAVSLGIAADALDFDDLADTMNLDVATTINAPSAMNLTMGPNVTLQVNTGKNLVVDAGDAEVASDTYMVHDGANDRIRLYVDGVEVARFKK